MADEQRSILSKPTDEAISWEGRKLTPKRIVEAWQRHGPEGLMKPFHDEVRRARNLRRGTLKREIAASWKERNPEAAAAALAKLPQRRTLEQDLKARIGAVEPVIIRHATGDLVSDETHARESQDYLNEWRTSPFGIPYRTFYTKGVEDGGYLRVRLPATLDLEGRPDFFERLTESAHAILSDDDKKAYTEDRSFKRKPYVKVGEDGKPKPAEKWDRDQRGRTRKDVGDGFKRDEKKSEQAHDDAVQRYLLSRPASTAQVYGGLDVAPIFKRGIGRDQAELAAAVTRQLVTVEEAVEMDYGWKGMNGRLLVPRGESDTNTVGKAGCYYLYTMFLTSKGKDGRVHPLIVYTLGGYGTTYGDGGSEPTDKDAVGMIDLCKTYGIESPKWSWHWGLQTGDDEPAYRGRPYLSDLADLILAIEGEEMAIRATTQVVSFTGHVEELGDALSGPNSEAVLGAVMEPGAKTIKRPSIPAPGEIVSTIGKIVPFQQTRIGDDAWRVLASDRQALAEATAVDQAASSPGSSGHAIVVGETLAKVAKRDVRESSGEACRRDAEDHLDILAAIERVDRICWPIKKVEEPPAGEATSEERYTVAEFNPDWVGEDGQFDRVKVEYPSETNIAELDLEAALADRGYSHFANVMKKKGIADPLKEYQEVLEWDIRRSDMYKMAITMGVAQRRGDKTMVAVLKELQAKQEMTQAGVPGAQNGVPTAALRRMGEKGPQQQGGATAASSQRGGIKAGEMGVASLNSDANAQMAVSPGGA
jgi:hypothetical protein